MYKVSASLLAVLFASSAAFAEGSGSMSEFFYQAEAGKSDLTPTLSIDSTEAQLTGSTAAEDSQTSIDVEYEYGLMPELTLGAKLGFVLSGETKSGSTTSDVSGMKDLEILAKGGVAAGAGMFRYGANLVIALEDKETETNGDTNAATGGMSLDPYVGYEMPVGGAGVIGTKLALELGLTDKTSVAADGTETETSGGESTSISVFYEHKLSEAMRFGVALDWITTSDEKNETSGGSTEQVSPVQVFSFYLPVNLGGGTLLPEIEYGMTTADDVGGTDIDSYDILNLAVGYRIAF